MKLRRKSQFLVLSWRDWWRSAPPYPEPGICEGTESCFVRYQSSPCPHFCWHAKLCEDGPQYEGDKEWKRKPHGCCEQRFKAEVACSGAGLLKDCRGLPGEDCDEDWGDWCPAPKVGETVAKETQMSKLYNDCWSVFVVKCWNIWILCTSNISDYIPKITQGR